MELTSATAGESKGRHAGGPHLSLIAKVTRICNLRCTYCHEWADTKSVMDFETLAHMTSKSLRASSVNSVRFIWHGGEPLVRGREFYEKALFLQQRCAREGQIVRNCLQTNGTLIDGDWVKFLRDNQFEVGLSFDGPQSLHDTQRPTAGGGGSWRKAVNAIKLFEEHGLPFGALVVVTDETIRLGPKALYDSLLSVGIRGFGLLHLRPESLPKGVYDPQTDFVPLDRFQQFEIDLFDLWFEADDPEVRIRDFQSIVKSLLGSRPTVCTLAGNCVGEHFGINVNGDVYHCDRYVSDGDYLLGNIRDDEWNTILSGERIQNLKSGNEKRVASFQQCSELKICNGGCPHNYYIERRAKGRSTPRCCGEAPLIRHIRKRLSERISGTQIAAALKDDARFSLAVN